MLTRAQLFSYGLFGLPLALVALPVYVMVPQLYAGTLQMPLTMVGAILLAARVLDAFIDPMLGHWMDSVRQQRGYGGFILLSLPLLCVGFVTLLLPPVLAQNQLAIWFGVSLMLVYGGYSLATIAHNSWGASLTQQRGERARLTATREGCALAGVVLAAALPPVVGLSGISIAFVVLLLAGALLLLKHAPRAPQQGGAPAARQRRWLLPWTVPRFRWLFAVYAMNGIAAAVPATLFLFFASDKLQSSQYAPLFLLVYFVSGGLALPLWARLAARIGEARAWQASMLLAVVAFAWTSQLQAGALLPFTLICMATGATLGADLALPPALLAGVIGAAGHGSEHEGSYFGLWSWVTKMNLALAAGISLPLLEWLGYAPGATDASALSALTIGYAVLPCILKIGAALLLWRAPLNDV